MDLLPKQAGCCSPYFDPANRLSCIRPVNAKTRSVLVFLKQIPGCHGERSQEFSYHAPSLSCGWEPRIIVAPTASPFHRKYESPNSPSSALPPPNHSPPTLRCHTSQNIVWTTSVPRKKCQSKDLDP